MPQREHPATDVRRTRSSVPGIYFRVTARGERTYEFVYRDSSGRQRWQCGYRTLAAARDERTTLQRRRFRGERIVPVRATFAEFGREWLDSQTHIRPSTRERYAWALEKHLIPRLGRRRLADIREDDIALLVAETSRELAPSSARSLLSVLSRVLGRGVRRGALTHNAVHGLERAERPKGQAREMRILQRPEITCLLAATPDKDRPLLATLTFCGLRIGEALALRWSDITPEGVRVRWQIDAATGERVAPKSATARREIVLFPALADLLDRHRTASDFASETDPVFASRVGTPLRRSNIRTRVLRPAVSAAGLAGPGIPPLRAHDLRHTFASLLIAAGASVVFVAAQMGHRKPTVTLNTYAHLFDARDHADHLTTVLQDGYADTISNPAASLAGA